MKLSPNVLATLIFMAVLAGCGSTSGTSTPHSTASPSDLSQTPTTASAPPATGSQAEEARHEGPGTVPNEVGQRLTAAEHNLRQRKIPFRVLRLRTPAQSAASELTVCASDPTPRTHLEAGTVLRLEVARTC
jgi:hypothetical protein